MIEKDDAVIVERVGNGYQVRPISRPSDMICIRDVMVFQDKGIVVAVRDYQDTADTLFGWLDAHFTGDA